MECDDVYFVRNLPTLRRKVLPPYSASSYENFTLKNRHFRQISIRILCSSRQRKGPFDRWLTHISYRTLHNPLFLKLSNIPGQKTPSVGVEKSSINLQIKTSVTQPALNSGSTRTTGTDFWSCYEYRANHLFSQTNAASVATNIHERFQQS
jgi:hypothetical protein